jgi:hypothetical protein
MASITVTELTAAVDVVTAAEAGADIPQPVYDEAVSLIIAATSAWADEAAHAALAVHTAVACLVIEEAAGVPDPLDQPR